VIGRNSDTGNASGCHLHFEIWSSPGWYEGGRAIRPDKRVRRWDGWS
jgi:murein DD-endopeptidase MepM/ murein hydrolase activator NlpD